ncbi:hypothetical protein C8J57DRAFT_1355279 [Mycena rebaudengoi]|nr:hypothetical protein C8J57DRAFT_1355279 [Mycena rebaudengoi]
MCHVWPLPVGGVLPIARSSPPLECQYMFLFYTLLTYPRVVAVNALEHRTPARPGSHAPCPCRRAARRGLARQPLRASSLRPRRRCGELRVLGVPVSPRAFAPSFGVFVVQACSSGRMSATLTSSRAAAPSLPKKKGGQLRVGGVIYTCEPGLTGHLKRSAKSKRH